MSDVPLVHLLHHENASWRGPDQNPAAVDGVARALHQSRALEAVAGSTAAN